MGRRTVSASARLAFALSAGLVLPGCLSNIDNVPVDNIVMLSERGRMVDPTGNVNFPGFRHLDWANYEQLDGDDNEHTEADKWIRNVVSKAVADAPVPRWDNSTRTTQRVTVFIHGGLNAQVDTVKRAAALSSQMSQDPSVGFPVFVNWPSSLGSTYWEHLTLVREGREGSGWFGALTAPFVFVTDALTVVARAPVVWTYSLRRAILGHQEGRSDDAAAVRTSAGEVPNVQCGQDVRSGWDRAGNTVGLYLWSPVRFVTAPFVDAFGRPAWENMKRRTTMIYHDKSEFRRSAPDPRHEDEQIRDPNNLLNDLAFGGAQGDLTRFFLHLRNEMDRRHGPGGWELTLIGHSMGTIIANGVLERFPDLPVENVVYMAAACSVKDYQRAVYGLLQRRSTAKAWNLVLHRQAEIGEQVPWRIELAPRGSLLVWIDSFFESPESWLDRTAGRFTNLIATEHLAKGLRDTRGRSIRERIFIKEFDFESNGDRNAPAKHGDFSKAEFWKHSFWAPDGTQHCPEKE